MYLLAKKISCLGSFLFVCLIISLPNEVGARSQGKAQTAKVEKADAPQPFNMTMGKTNLSEAREIWLAEGAEVGGDGYGDAKPSYGDSDPDGVANKRVVLVDVKGLPLDRLESARFGFFDQTLYLIKYSFEDGADFEKIYLQVVAKYGHPKRRGGFGDEFFEWAFGPVVLGLTKDFFGRHTMTFLHQPTLEKVRASNASVYAEHVKTRASQQKAF